MWRLVPRSRLRAWPPQCRVGTSTKQRLGVLGWGSRCNSIGLAARVHHSLGGMALVWPRAEHAQQTDESLEISRGAAAALRHELVELRLVLGLPQAGEEVLKFPLLFLEA